MNTEDITLVMTTPSMRVYLILVIPSGCVGLVPFSILMLNYTQDTYRAAWAWLILFAPERVPGMVQSMIQDYEEVCRSRTNVIAYSITLSSEGWLASNVEKCHR